MIKGLRGLFLTDGPFFHIFLFSGSLYLLALTGIKWLGAITPIGGIAFLLGGAFLGFKIIQAKV